MATFKVGDSVQYPAATPHPTHVGRIVRVTGNGANEVYTVDGWYGTLPTQWTFTESNIKSGLVGLQETVVLSTNSMGILRGNGIGGNSSPPPKKHELDMTPEEKFDRSAHDDFMKGL